MLKEFSLPPALALDITSTESVVACVKAVKSKYKRIHCLINNAGVSTKDHPNDPVTKTAPDDLNWCINVNVGGTLRVTQAFLPLLVGGPKEDPGKVVNLSSDLGSISNNCPDNKIGQPCGNKTAYRCSKAALNMLTRTFAAEVKDVTFAAVSPGWVATDMGSKGGRKPPLTVPQSCAGMVEILGKLSLEKTGSFISVSQGCGDIDF